MFVEGLRRASANKPFQNMTDGFSPYKSAITTIRSERCDYAMFIRVYRAPSEAKPLHLRRVPAAEGVPVMGRPYPERICISIVEWSNLSLRMGLHRFTRLTNAFSKKWENHWAAVSLWHTFYNFCRVHKSLRVTPAMAAGITARIWTLREPLDAA